MRIINSLITGAYNLINRPRLRFDKNISLRTRCKLQSFFGTKNFNNMISQFVFNGGDMVQMAKEDGKYIVFIGLDTKRSYTELWASVHDMLARECLK